LAKKYSDNKKIKIIKDQGRGKSYALNFIFSSIKTDILILTDGDVLISENSVEDITNLFLDPEIGCVTGNPTPAEDKKTKYGYWANFLFNAAHVLRKKAFESSSFIECSGYLFAFRKNKIKEIPLDTAEDTIIPYYFWERGYKIGYAENAKVYVKNVSNWKEWIEQKTRTSKAHENLDKYADTKVTPRIKTFRNESKEGISIIMSYPNNLREIFWTYELVIARFYMWSKVFLDTRIKNKNYQDAWKRVESAR
jgi:glycosyltransferase involved in cell wall biosynthesis